MRSFFLSSLAVAGLASAAVAHITHTDAERPYRKSLGFGPVHPHAVFRSSPYVVPFGLGPSSFDDPLKIATAFVKNLLSDVLSESSSFQLRKDSYTDTATGVTHAYFRQIVNDVEVVDGDINVNVKDGVVLSYGDSVSRLTRSYPGLHSH
jgi:extracellular elastinolytic metalloproteinase